MNFMRTISTENLINEVELQFKESTCLTIGNFDGVHIGHQALVRSLTENAKSKNQKSVVLTFNPHPLEVLHPESQLRRLFDINDQQRMFSQLGVDYLVVQKFTKDLAKLPANDFFIKYLVETLKVKHLIIGHDFQFGKNREAGENELAQLCSERKIELTVVPPVVCRDQVVSSTLIRNNLELGKLKLANEMLGRAYYLSGTVVRGDQRGRTIGFPTANLDPTVEPFLKIGVYQTMAYFDGQVRPSITNVGYHPTFHVAKKVKIETHILDYDGDLYDHQMRVEFLDYIRGEQKFESLQALISQINADIVWVRNHES